MTIRTVLRKELRLLRGDRGLQIALALFALLFAYALANGVAWTTRMEETASAVTAADAERTSVIEAELERIAEGGAPPSPFRDMRAPKVLGGKRGARTAALDPGPLAALSIGQSDLLPYYYDVSIETNEQTFLQNGEVENPLNLMVGRFDLAFVLVYLMPLLVLALSYNVLSSEREQGTLALTLSQPVSARGVVGTKLLFRAVLVIGLALAVSLVGAAVSGALGAPGASGRLLLWCTTVVAYALFWFGLAAWVDSLGRTSAWNATVVVGAWLGLVVLLPAVVNITANVLHPLPSRVEMISTARDASNEAVNRRSELLSQYLEDHPEFATADAPDANSSGALAWAATEEVNRRVAEVSARFDERLAAQHAIVRRYRFLSPALLAQQVLNDTAGTGDARFQRFDDAVRNYADELREFFVPAILAGETMTIDDLAKRPSFAFVDESTSDVVDRSLVPLAALLALGLLVTAPAALSLGRVRGGIEAN